MGFCLTRQTSQDLATAQYTNFVKTIKKHPLWACDERVLWNECTEQGKDVTTRKICTTNIAVDWHEERESKGLYTVHDDRRKPLPDLKTKTVLAGKGEFCSNLSKHCPFMIKLINLINIINILYICKI